MPLKDLTKEDCEKWKLNKLKNPKSPKNPKTNYKVTEGSKTYKDIDKRCSSLERPDDVPKARKKWTIAECRQWEVNKTIDPHNPLNPMTNKPISANTENYKKLNEKCKKILIGNAEKAPTNSTGSSGPLGRKLTLEDCIKWSKDKTKNPVSNYRLRDNSIILKEIVKQCKPLLDNIPKNKIPSPSPKNNSSPSLKPKILSPRPKSPSPVSENVYLHYPDLDDKNFRDKLTRLAEYYIYNVPEYGKIKTKGDFVKKSDDLCKHFEKTAYQYFISSYISSRTPYKGALLYHGVGVGKTCSAITLAEGFLTNHSIYDEPKIWVIMPLALKTSFKEQIFNMANNTEDYQQIANQCTGDLYIKLAQILRESNKDKIKTKIKNLLKSRYKLFTYEGFATFIENEYIDKDRVVKDKVIIVDEAHNIRSMASAASSSSSEASEKRVYTSLLNIMDSGVNNRLVLLSATPMYNKPDDIFDLLYLLCLNDKRYDLLTQPYPPFFTSNNSINKKAADIIERLSANYISYLRGKNPFTFASKLSPKYIPYLTFLSKEFETDSNGKIIHSSYKGWLEEVDDGIVTSALGPNQEEFVRKSDTKADDNNVFNNLQPMNIVYDDSIGENGFNTFFSRNDDIQGLNVRYNKNYVNALFPDDRHLGVYSGKFLNICNIIKNTTGIVVIYSGYIWSGIVPLAIALEHMGFQREGGNNILAGADIISNPPRYNQKTSPKYCILSSENTEVMGGSSIDNLMKIINNPKNIDGSLIKAILITPVAGEGLSFYNVREMHIVEPWFHFNRVTQIIGRGIRNCRHQDLPLEERNVTVFMHASVYADKEQETTDIHAFRIAAKKLMQTNVVDKLIRDNAVDCILMKNINYFSTDIFELGKIRIMTSQNIEIDHTFGDKQSDEPRCSLTGSKNIITTGFKKDTYQNLIFAMQNKLRKLVAESINSNPPSYYITFDEIMNRLQFNKKVVYEAVSASVYPNILIDGFILTPHNDGLHIVQILPQKQVRLRLSFKKEIKTPNVNAPISSNCNHNKLNSIANKNSDNAILALYNYLTPNCYIELVKHFIEDQELSEVDETIANLLYKEGALISSKELKSLGRKEKYIGYVNIFNITDFEPILYANDRYRDLIEREVDELLSKRHKMIKPSNMAQEAIPWGMIVPVLDKKTNIYSNVFKILTAGSSVGTKTGIVCSSLQKQAQDAILRELGFNQTFTTKAEYCHNIALQLYGMKRLTLYPEYKPKA